LILDSNSQTTATSAGNGGDIHILGDHVGLAGHSKVDASGQTGGGTVLIGGDYHGENQVCRMPNGPMSIMMLSSKLMQSKAAMAEKSLCGPMK